MASDGLDAIEVARDFQPDLLLIDIRMPGIDGVETFQRLRAELPSLAAIFMTAYSSSDKSKEAEEWGAIRVLGKPLDLSHLMKLVEASLDTAPVLIADDDPTLLKSIARAIEANGVNVETVSSLRDATRALRQRPSRVVVADVFLQDGFGYELLKETQAGGEASPFILITGRSDWLTTDVARQIQARVICLCKPIDIDDLLNKVNR
jgi:DNA-binding NtrC family response regulator